MYLCKECIKKDETRLDEYRFLTNLCELHQSDKIEGFEFSELIKQFAGYSSAGNYLHESLIERGIDINDYNTVKIS